MRRLLSSIVLFALCATLASAQGARILRLGGFHGAVSEGGGGSTDVVEESDLTYLGKMYLPASNAGGNGTYYENSNGILAVRRVGDDIHLFVSGTVGGSGDFNGNFDATYEVKYNGVGTGNRATLVHDWGDIYDGRRLIVAAEAWHTRGYLWDEDRGCLWWNGQTKYYTGSINQPTLGMTCLDDGDFSKTAYGPWRSNEFAQLTKGWMTWLPEDFAAAYTNDNRIAVGAPVSAQNSGGPRGAILFAVNDFDPLTLAPDIVDPDGMTGSDSISLQRIIYSDLDHPQLRTMADGDYKITFWQSPGAHSTSVGSTSVGSTSIAVADTSLYAFHQSISAYANTGACGLSGTHYSVFPAGGAEFYYTGRSTTSGAGNLTGIPASGCGSILGTIVNGTILELGTYDSQKGGHRYDGSPDFRNLAMEDGKPVPGAGELAYDSFHSGTWVKTAGNEAFMVAGQMLRTLSGFDYSTPTFPSGTVPHMWYGPKGNNIAGAAGYPETTTADEGRDPYGHVGWSGGTGPIATTFVPVLQIWSRASMAAGAAGGSASWSQLPTTTITLSDLIDVPVQYQGAYVFGGMAFEPVSRLLFISDTIFGDDPLQGADPRPIVHVIQVAD